MNQYRLASTLAAALLTVAAGGTALAQAPAPAPAPAPAAPAAAPAPVSAAKKQLVARVLEIQRANIEAVASNIAAAPVMQMQQQIAAVLQQRVEPERRQAVAREIEADVRKYMEETVPLLRERALRVAPTSIGTLLEQRFTEEELRQLITLLQSPIHRKYQGMTGEMQRVLTEQLAPEVRPVLEPRLRALDQTVGGRLGITAPGGGASAPVN